MTSKASQSKNSFNFCTNPFCWGCTSEPSSFAKASSKSRWRAVSAVGTSTVSSTSWSPLPLRERRGIPFPLMRRRLPGWVPAGIFSFPFPSMVGTSSSPPSAGLHERNGDRTDHVVARPLEERVRSYHHHQLEIARRLTFAREIPPALDRAGRPIFDPRRDGHRNRPRHRQEPSPAARLTRMHDQLSRSVATRAGRDRWPPERAPAESELGPAPCKLNRSRGG